MENEGDGKKQRGQGEGAAQGPNAPGSAKEMHKERLKKLLQGKEPPSKKPGPRPKPVRNPFERDERPAVAKGAKGFAPLSWHECFDRQYTLEAEDGSGHFNVYEKGEGKVSMLCLHGGGHSALSWGAFAKAMHANEPCRIIAYDCRGHGNTTVKPETELSKEQQCNDLQFVCSKVLHGEPVIVVGHSMGGAMGVHAVKGGYVPNPAAVVVLDVVEGTAISALAYMSRFIKARPTHFESLEQAIAWSLKAGQLSNLASARISMPGQLIGTRRGEVRARGSRHLSSMIAEEPEGEDTEQEEEEAKAQQEQGQKEKGEQEQEQGKGTEAASIGGGLDTKGPQEPQPLRSADDDEVFAWRVDLKASEPYWQEWFHGLSDAFLACPCARILVLAGVDRLDTPLTIGQMQGKFQLHVVRDTGHSVQEDQPENLAQVLGDFVRRSLTLWEKTGML